MTSATSPVSGSAEALAALGRATGHLLRFKVEVIDEAAAAAAADPTCALAAAMNAYLALMSTEPSGVAGAKSALDALSADGRDRSPLEEAHLEAARRWAGGDMTGAGALLAELSLEHPRDLLALAVGHQIDFYTGDAPQLRDRIGRALGAWGPDEPERGFLCGMYAFGLEECNSYGRSEEVGQQAVEANAEDVWAIHAVVHTYEMQGRIADGVGYLQRTAESWKATNFLTVHNSWHYALYLLQAGRVDDALDVYDSVLHHAGSGDVALELLDATSLLWRLHLDGAGVGDRWQPLADAWGRIVAPGYYPFNDAHAAMAFAGAGESAGLDTLVDALQGYARSGDSGHTGWQMTVAVGLPVCGAIRDFAAGRYGAVVDALWPIRSTLHNFGGSHAQRDAIERTLLVAAMRSGRHGLAAALVSERVAVNPRSTYGWSMRAALADLGGDRADAVAAAAERDRLTAAITASL